MIDDKTIRMFCSKDETRTALLNPFNFGDYTYATDGHMGIRIERRQEYDGNEIKKIVETIITYDAVDDRFWMDLPDLGELIETINCPYCEGTGKSTCQMCRGTKKSGKSIECEECSGTGKTTKSKYLDVGSKLLNGQLLSVMKNLPGVKIAPEAVENLKAIPFKFDDGIGVIMPIRRPE